MIKKNAQAEIKDVRTGNSLLLEVNFDENQKDCVKISFNDQDFIVKYADLFAFMFSLATKEQQAKMVPVREELGNQYMKQIQVKLTKDLKAGEFLVVNVPINVPQVIEDAILSEKKLSTEEIKTPYLTSGKDNV